MARDDLDAKKDLSTTWPRAWMRSPFQLFIEGFDVGIALVEPFPIQKEILEDSRTAALSNFMTEIHDTPLSIDLSLYPDVLPSQAFAGGHSCWNSNGSQESGEKESNFLFGAYGFFKDLKGAAPVRIT